MAFKGFDPAVVTESINKVKTAYDNFITAIPYDVQAKFVNGMHDKWACKQAQDFFAIFKGEIDRIVESTNITIESVVNSMNSGAKLWAATTETTWSDISISTSSFKLDVDGIQENINGVRGIDTEASSTAKTLLDSILSDAKKAISDLRTAVIECGFIDATESSNLQRSIAQISQAMDTISTNLLEQCDNSIKLTVANYEEASNRIASAYAGQ